MTQRALLAALACVVTVASASAQVVDLPTSTIERRDLSSAKFPIRRVQAEVPQAEVPQAEAVQPPAGVPAPVPLPEEPAPFPGLNVDPNANITDLAPPQPLAPPTAAANFNTAGRPGLGATAGSFSSAPTMIGDFFGGGFSSFGGTQTVSFSGYSAGTILSGGPGQSNSILGFEFGTDTVPNDIFTSGLGADLVGNDGFADSFSIAEPLVPNDALTSPGPGFIFDGGTAVYTDNTTDTTPQGGIYTNGEQWFISYSYSQTLANGGSGQGGRPVPGPGVAMRRVKIAENFSPEVRDRCFASYNFFNDAFGGLGDVSRYVLGAERILVDELISIEARLPMAGTYGSTQVLELAAARNFEFGDAALIAKAVLLRSNRFIWSSGLGVTLPTADNTHIQSGGQDVLVVKNKTVHLLPFMALLLRQSADTNMQAYMQLDVAANGDPVYGDLTGGPLPRIGVFNDSTLMHLDMAISHVIYRNRGSRPLRQVIANGELHYTGTMQDSDLVSSGGLTFTDLKGNFNVLNATAGAHFVLCNNLVVTPAMSVPLRSGLDEQFDYEAVVQVNYLR